MKEQGAERTYILDLKECLVRGCGGELGELSYYERNNWVTSSSNATSAASGLW